MWHEMTVCNCLVSIVVISSFCLDWEVSVRPPVIQNDGLILYPGGNQSPLTESWWRGKKRKKKLWFFQPAAHYCINKQTVSHQNRWIVSLFKAKPRCLNRGSKTFLFFHITLTHVCLILAPRQDIITTQTAQHWIADEMKLLP